MQSQSEGKETDLSKIPLLFENF